MRPVRILHCVGAMNRGGVETWLMQVLQHVDRRQFAMDFCCLSGEPGVYAPEIEALGGQVHTCRLTKNVISFSREFEKLLRSQRYDVVHSHVHSFSGFVLWRANRCGVSGRIAHSHNTSEPKAPRGVRRLYKAWMFRLLERYANAGIAASGEAGAALFGAGWRANSRWQIIRCGVDLAPFLAASEWRSCVRASLGLPADAFVVGHVGRFDKQKNHDLFVQIAAEAVKLAPHSYFLLVGNGILKPEIEAKVGSLGLSQRFVFAGLRGDVPQLLNAMDVFLMPSLYEGLPVAGLEAQAAGLPVVFSDTITSEAAVLPEMVSYLSLNQSPAQWAAAVVRADAQTRPDAERRQRAFAAGGFSIDASVQSLTKLYAALAQE